MLGELLSEAAAVFSQIITGNGNHLTPVAVLTINGLPLGTHTASRIISIQLADNRGFEADELTIELSDHDGALAIPQTDGIIECALGFVETGIVKKGRFKISEFTHSGAPDKLSITARAADLAETLAEQQERSWHKTTLGKIVETIAKQHKYECIMSEDLQNIEIAHIDQTNESDASFLTRLSNLYDAIATVKDGKLLFMKTGEAKTASGKPIAPITITRMSGDGHTFTYSATNNYSAVRAYYIEPKTGKKQEIIINKDNAYTNKKPQTKNTKSKQKGKKNEGGVQSAIVSDGDKVKTLRHLYASKATATSGAQTAFRKIKRGMSEFKIKLAVGRPDIYPETPVIVSGFKSEIDSEKWLVSRITHSVNDGGYTSDIELEALLNE